MNCIEIDNISIKFRLYHERTFTLKEKVINIIKRKNSYEDFYALKNLSLNVKVGDVLGIIGENGAGKSTLLKVICGVLKPQHGSVAINGNISALLELGAGFDPELTGRENVFMNGSLMGYSKKQMLKKFDHIVEFSELENFIDLPVKNYSSGMYMRLGFAIAIDVDPEILIIDEILAVGDASFQKKCMQKVNEFKNKGKTIILVSHNHGAIKEFCDKAIWIKNGEKVIHDSSERVVYEYLRFLQKREKDKFEEEIEESYRKGGDKGTDLAEDAKEEKPAREEQGVLQEVVSAPETVDEIIVTKDEPAKEIEDEPEDIKRWGTFELTIDSVEFYNSGDEKKNVFEVGEDFYVKMKYSVKKPLSDPGFAIQIFREDGRYVHGSNTVFRKVKIGAVTSTGEIIVRYNDVSLGGGVYLVRVVSTRKEDKEWQDPYDFQNMTHKFLVQDQENRDMGQVGESYLRHEWEIKR